VNPTILFVDEPTSGLSSRDSEKHYGFAEGTLAARKNDFLWCCISRLLIFFKMFDTLLILDVGGFQIYYGNPIESVSYFRDIVNAANKTQGACPGVW
jgi:ABC-type multidrug transport system ATPase subunit